MSVPLLHGVQHEHIKHILQLHFVGIPMLRQQIKTFIVEVLAIPERGLSQYELTPW